MARHQKIKQILNISLISLLFLAGCSTPKQPGVALYMPERSYKRAIADTMIVAQHIELLDLIDSVENTMPMIIDTVIISPDFYSVEKDDYIIELDKKEDIAAIGSFIDTLIVDKNTTQSISDKAIAQAKEQRDEISEDEKTVALITDTVIIAAKIDSTLIIYTKPDTTTILAEKIRKADDKPTEITDTIVKTITIEQTDTIFKTVEIEKQDTIYRNIEVKRAEPISVNRPVNTNIYSQNPTSQKYHQDIEKFIRSAVSNQASERPMYDNRQVEYENVYSNNNPARSSEWQQPIVAQAGRVQIQSGEHYLTTATESQKNYLQQPSIPPQAQASILPSNRELTQLQAKINELTNQNSQLRSTLYGIQNTIDGHRISSEQTSQASNEQKIAEISSRLDAITNLLTANATNQAEGRDTVIQKTIINTKLVENPNLIAEIANLQDSIVQLQSYIYLKDKAFDSLEGKLIAPKRNDSILFTAYYNPGKTISTKEKAILDELNQKIVDRRIMKVSLISYTDSSGSPDLNLRLSNQRVVRWIDELVKNGIPRKLIFMQYFGAEYASKEVIANERRVEIIVEMER